MIRFLKWVKSKRERYDGWFQHKLASNTSKTWCYTLAFVTALYNVAYLASIFGIIVTVVGAVISFFGVAISPVGWSVILGLLIATVSAAFVGGFLNTLVRLEALHKPSIIMEGYAEEVSPLSALTTQITKISALVHRRRELFTAVDTTIRMPWPQVPNRQVKNIGYINNLMLNIKPFMTEFLGVLFAAIGAITGLCDGVAYIYGIDMAITSYFSAFTQLFGMFFGISAPLAVLGIVGSLVLVMALIHTTYQVLFADPMSIWENAVEKIPVNTATIQQLEREVERLSLVKETFDTNRRMMAELKKTIAELKTTLAGGHAGEPHREDDLTLSISGVMPPNQGSSAGGPPPLRPLESSLALASVVCGWQWRRPSTVDDAGAGAGAGTAATRVRSHSSS